MLSDVPRLWHALQLVQRRDWRSGIYSIVDAWLDSITGDDIQASTYILLLFPRPK